MSALPEKKKKKSNDSPNNNTKTFPLEKLLELVTTPKVGMEEYCPSSSPL